MFTGINNRNLFSFRCSRLQLTDGWMYMFRVIIGLKDVHEHTHLHAKFYIKISQYILSHCQATRTRESLCNCTDSADQSMNVKVNGCSIGTSITA